VLKRVEAVRAELRHAREIADPQELRRRAAVALRELFHRMALERPLVLWIDDLQWGDIDSAALIEELLRPPDPPPLLLIASYRSEDASAALVTALHQVDERNGGAVQIFEVEVGALERDEARALAVALLGNTFGTARFGDRVGVARRPFFVDVLCSI
jgi:predicted ATPase